MSLWRSFRALRPRIRVYIGVGVMVYAGLGLVATDKAEEKFGMVATEEDRKALGEMVPRVGRWDSSRGL
ncbi:MAG: hypothetical protein LQ351_003772 [Letrouitia transgressa]|nr:MAG: hypothetical protein LQ351_003772 [Letrouitia transgressa]